MTNNVLIAGEFLMRNQLCEMHRRFVEAGKSHALSCLFSLQLKEGWWENTSRPVEKSDAGL